MTHRSTRRQILGAAAKAAVMAPMVVSLSPKMARAEGSWHSENFEPVEQGGGGTNPGARTSESFGFDERNLSYASDRPAMSWPSEMEANRSGLDIPYSYRWRESRQQKRIIRREERAFWDQTRH